MTNGVSKRVFPAGASNKISLKLHVSNRFNVAFCEL